MDTNKEHNPSMPERITSEEVKTLQAYIEELEGLKELPAKLTAEEWKEATTAINNTGIIPDKYKGRIIPEEITLEYDTIQIKDEDGNLILNENGKPQFRQIPINPPKKEIVYHDSADIEYMHRRAFIEGKYHELVIKALRTHKGNAKDIAGIIQELLEDPEIRREFEKEVKAAQKTALAPLGSVPNGDSLNWLYRVISASKGGRMVQESTGNRHEKITARQYGDKIRFTRTNKQKGSTVIVEIDQADKYLMKTNKTFTKILLFALQKMTAQNNPLEVGFPLQELVDLGMYYDISTARRAVKEFFTQQKLTTLSGTVKKGRKTVKEEGGILFYHYKINNGFVTLSVNENFNLDFIANYFTVFPRFAYALSNNAFSLVRYIFFLARQNAQDIKDKGTFTISLEAVRENLGLPSVDEVNNRKYRQFIIEPVKKAIKEVEEALLNVPEAKEYGFTITPCGTDTSNIREWLQGYLEIGLNGDFAETFIRLATKAEKDREQWKKIKQAELAKIAARQEAKEAQEAQEAPKRTRGRKKKT